MNAMVPNEATLENMDAIKATMTAQDQADELIPGCVTWGITYAGGQRGQMTEWPCGRGAICMGADSEWGEWDNGVLAIDDSATAYNMAGEEIATS